MGDRCCWSKCNEKAVCSITYVGGKGDLKMCEKCYKEYNDHCDIREEGFRQDGQFLGLKMGLEVAKDVAKKQGYEFSFPNPEDIKIETLKEKRDKKYNGSTD